MPALPGQEGRQDQRRDGHEQPLGRAVPLLALHERQQQGHHARPEEYDAHRVQALGPAVPVARRRKQPPGQRQRRQPDRHVHVEHPSPAVGRTGERDQRAADERPGRRGDPDHRAERAERPAALRATEEDLDQPRDLRVQHPARNALHEPRDDQPQDRRGDARHGEGLVGAFGALIYLWGRRGHVIANSALVVCAIGMLGSGLAGVSLHHYFAGKNRLLPQSASGPPSSPTHESEGSPSQPSTATTPAAVNTIKLTDLDMVGDENFSVGPQKINGRQYDEVVYVDYVGQYATSQSYNLDRKYSTLQTKVGLGDQSESGVVVKYRILVDGVVKASTSIEVGRIKDLSVSVSGAFRIQIDILQSGQHGGNATAAMIDAKLTQ